MPSSERLRKTTPKPYMAKADISLMILRRLQYGHTAYITRNTLARVFYHLHPATWHRKCGIHRLIVFEQRTPKSIPLQSLRRKGDLDRCNSPVTAACSVRWALARACRLSKFVPVRVWMALTSVLRTAANWLMANFVGDSRLTELPPSLSPSLSLPPSLSLSLSLSQEHFTEAAPAFLFCKNLAARCTIPPPPPSCMTTGRDCNHPLHFVWRTI